MGRHAKKLELPQQDRAILERWSKSKRVSAHQHERAIMILESAAGLAVKDIAAKLNTYSNKVIEWRTRYESDGLVGLQDKERKGRPKMYEGLKERLLKKLSEPPPQGYGRWVAVTRMQDYFPKSYLPLMMRYGGY